MKIWFVISLLLIVAAWGAHAWAEDQPNIDSLSWPDIVFGAMVVLAAINWLAFAGFALGRAL